MSFLGRLFGLGNRHDDEPDPSNDKADWKHDEPNAYINGGIWREMRDAARRQDDPDRDDRDDDRGWFWMVGTVGGDEFA